MSSYRDRRGPKDRVGSSRDNVSSSLRGRQGRREPTLRLPAPQGGWGLGASGTVNSGEVLINVVMFVELKVLTSSGQKACGQGQGLSYPLPQMFGHRRRGTPYPAHFGTDVERGNPVVLPASGTASRKASLWDSGCRRKEQANA